MSVSEGNVFLQPGSRSAQLYQRATRVLPGGNSRQTVFTAPYPYYAKRGYGCRVVDEEGEERIDFINNLTSLILGHAHPKVVEAVTAQVQHGSCFGSPTETEIRLAEIITSRVTSVEQMRFTNCGTEAVMAAIKGARAYTGRHRIAKCEGCFHGAYDYVEVSLDPSPETGGDPRAPKPVRYSPGAAPGILGDVVVMPFNDLEAAKAIIERERENLACVIVDPMPNRIGMIPAKPGFLCGLREITRRHQILLLSDEVISFRLAYHGAQSLFGYEPDLTTFGKVIGGGYPVGAIGGPTEVMSVFDGTRGKAKVPHAGTFNANPVTMTAGIATLEQVTPETFDYLDKLGEAVRGRLNALFRSTGFEAQASGAGSIFRILLTSAPLSDYRSALVPPERKAVGYDLYMGLLARGVALTNTLVGCISTPMTLREVDALVGAVEDWLRSR